MIEFVKFIQSWEITTAEMSGKNTVLEFVTMTEQVLGIKPRGIILRNAVVKFIRHLGLQAPLPVRLIQPFPLFP